MRHERIEGHMLGPDRYLNGNKAIGRLARGTYVSW